MGFGGLSKGCSGGGSSGQNDDHENRPKLLNNVRGGFNARGRGGWKYQQNVNRRSNNSRPNHNNRKEVNLKDEDAPFIEMPESISHAQLLKQKLTPGTVGTPIELISNFYKLITSNVVAYRYAFEIKRDVNRKKKKEKYIVLEPSMYQLHEQSLKHRQIMMQFISENEDIFKNIIFAYDVWKHSFCTTKPLNLPKTEFTQRSKINGTMRGYIIKFKLIGPVDMSQANDFYRGHSNKMSNQVLIVLETVLRYQMAKMYEPCFFKFFDFATNEPSKLHDFKFHEFIRGFVSSVRRTEFGLALNVHLQTGCIISKTYKELVYFVSDIADEGRLSKVKPLAEWKIRRVNQTIRGLKIYFTKKPEKILEIDSIIDVRPSERFVKLDNVEISMADLYKHQYQIKVQIRVPKNQPPKYLPLEYCNLVDKQFMRRMHPSVKEEYEEKKAIPPGTYFNTAQTFVEQIAANEPELMQQFGLQIIAKPTSIFGRVLPDPKMLSCKEEEKFFKTALIPKKWAMICFDDNISFQELTLFYHKILAKSISLDLKLGDPVKIASESIESALEIPSILQRTLQEEQMKNIELLMFAIPRKHSKIFNTNDIFHMIFHLCIQVHRITFQCIDSKKITKSPDGYFDSFIQKLNAKLGGQNTSYDEETLRLFPFDSNRTMIVGAYVNHSGKDVHSSIATMVATYDRLFAKYTAAIRTQKKNAEIIFDVESMFDQLLAEYHLHNGRYPDNVILLRSQVTNGKFDSLRNVEIRLVKQSISKTRTNTKLSVLVVKKKTTDRFVQSLPRIASELGSQKPNLNVPSGTVVDQYIVDPCSKEFYLVSQSNEHGTSSPSKYIILHDDLNLKTDQMQQVCFNLCHNSARTRKVVGYPIAMQYADLCTERSVRIVAAHRLLSTQKNCDIKGVHDCDQEQLIIRDLNAMIKHDDRTKNLLINS